MKQSVRDEVRGALSLEYFAKRMAEGWMVAGVEWVREIPGTEPVTDGTNVPSRHAELPYGMNISAGGVLRENPLEASVLLLILEQIVREKRIQEIAGELNLQGFATRAGKPWSASDVFNLMPRLIEAGPSLLKSVDWQRRRKSSLVAPNI